MVLLCAACFPLCNAVGVEGYVFGLSRFLNTLLLFGQKLTCHPRCRSCPRDAFLAGANHPPSHLRTIHVIPARAIGMGANGDRRCTHKGPRRGLHINPIVPVGVRHSIHKTLFVAGWLLCCLGNARFPFPVLIFHRLPKDA